MGISYDVGTETITVTGGSQDSPYTMADLDADGTVGQYITPGGYGSREYAVSKDLVIGSEDAETFFDVSSSIIKMNAGKFLTVYTTALRGGAMGATFGEREGASGAAPFLEDTVKAQRIEGIRMLYKERVYYLDNTTGVWVVVGPVPRIVAVAEDGLVAAGPYI